MDPVRARLAELAPGVELLENLRFDPGEEATTRPSSAQLVDGIDAYVNDAFGASHRAHASIVGRRARPESAAGRLLEREVEVLLGCATSPSARSSPCSAAPRSATSSASSRRCSRSSTRS